MAIKFSNLASTTLASGVSDTATSLSVTSASLFPTLGGSDYFYATIGTGTGSEIVKVTAISGTTFTAVRGQDGTTAISHSSGAEFSLRVTAAALNDLSTQADTESVSIAGDTMTGNLKLSDGTEFQLGDSSEFKIKHHASGYTHLENTVGTLFIDSDSVTFRDDDGSPTNVLINQSGIDVTGSVTADGLTVEGATTPVIRLESETSFLNVNTAGKIEFYTNDASTNATGVGAEIVADSVSTLASVDLIFKTRNSAVSSSTVERLKVANNGDISFYEDTGTTPKLFWDASAESLGIGDSNPSFRLDVNNTSSRVRFKAATGNSNLELSAIEGRDYVLQSLSDGKFRIYDEDASAERLTINADGSSVFSGRTTSANSTVGSGTASTYVDLTVNGASTSNYGPMIELQSAGTAFGKISNVGRIQGGTSTDMFVTTASTNSLVLGTNNTPRVTINSSGNATFSGSVTSTGLTVDGDITLSGDKDIHLTATNPNSGSAFQYGEITFGDSNSAQFGNHAKIISKGSYADNSTLEFHTSSNNSSPLNMKLDQNGNLNLINGGLMVGSTTAPASALHIKTSVDNSVSQGLVIERSASSDKGYINYQGGAFRMVATDGDPIRFGHVSNSARFSINADGSSVFSGSVTSTGLTVSTIYPKLQLNSTSGVPRNFSVGTNNETFTIRNETASSDSLTISNTNNVNIGSNLMVGATTAPSAKLDVSLPSGTNGDIINMARSGGAYNFHLGLDENSTWYVSNASNEKILNVAYTGNVGIGNSSPTDKLHLGTSSGGTQLKIQSGSGVNNCVLHTNGTTDSWRTGMNLAVTNGSYEFYDDVNNVSRLVIDSSGRVGIGMVPQTVLDLQATDNLALRFYNSTSFKAGIQVPTTAGDMIAGSAVNDLAIRSQTNMLFATGGNTERMRIDSSGQLSLATTEDKARMTIGLTGVAITGDTDGATMGENAIVHLHNSSSIATNSTVMLLGGGGGVTGQIKSGIGFSRENGSNWGTQLRFYTHSTSTSDLDELKERLRIDASGNLTTRQSTGNNFRVIRFGDNSIEVGNYNATDGYQNTTYISSTHTFYAGTAGAGSAARAVDIDSSGNLLVGTTSTALNTSNSESGHNLFDSGYTVHSRSGQTVMSVNRLSNDGSIVDFRKDGTVVGSIQSRAGLVSTIVLDPRSGQGAGLTGAGAGGDTLRHITPTNESRVEVNGKVSLGNSTNGFRDLYLSGGVYQSGTRLTKRTSPSSGGSGIFASITNAPQTGFIHIYETGTDKYAILACTKRDTSANVVTTVVANNGLTVTATNAGGTVAIGGYTSSGNVKMQATIIREA